MSLSPWIKAARPRTLTLSMMPVIVGTALAWAAEGRLRWPAVVAALIGSMFIQLGTNLHNDAADSERGGDGPDRVGPARVTASGLLDGGAVKRGACACFAVAAVTGFYLVWIGGWPIFLLGVLSILSGWAYTGGPLPIAYTPFGELFVVAFFGVGAVCGTYWLCTATLGLTAIEAGLAMGFLTGAVLLVNNHRDVEADARVGRRDSGHRDRSIRDELGLCGSYATPVRAARSDWSRARARLCVFGAHPIAARGRVDLPLRPRTTRPRVQSDTPTNRANSDVVRPIALCRSGVVTTLGLVSHIASAQVMLRALRRLLLEFCL